MPIKTKSLFPHRQDRSTLPRFTRSLDVVSKMAASMQGRIERLLQDLKGQYCKLVRSNPDTVSQIESAVRILSFLVAGTMDDDDLPL